VTQLGVQKVLPMTESSSADDDLQCTDVLLQLAASDPSGNAAAASTATSEPMSADQASNFAQLQAELAACNTLLLEREHALIREQRRVQQLQEQLVASDSPAPNKSAAANPFDMVLTLSSEREAALRERKAFKDRAVSAEAHVAQLESDLAAAHAAAKLQTERADKLIARHEELQQRMAALDQDKLAQEQRITLLNQHQPAGHAAATDNDAIVMLQQLLKERDKKILDLEMQLTDRAGAPTLFNGELERHAPHASPSAMYVLESLDTPGQLHKLGLPINTVGRNKSNDILLDSPSISRYHARLLNNSDGVWLIDLQSSNGCHVNDQRISSQVLSEGDLVVIGECRFRFSSVARSQAAATHSYDQATRGS
jgi:hypothetical protein